MIKVGGLERKKIIFVVLNALVLECFYLNAQAYLTRRLQVANGYEASKNTFPFMVAIRTTNNDLPVLCGGTLIHPQLVLTAAKCINGSENAELQLGSHSLKDPGEYQQIFKVTKESFLIHESYTEKPLRHDIAVIVLSQPAKLNENVQTVKIPTMDDVINTYDETLGIIVGWGKLNDTIGEYSDKLQYGEVTVIPLVSCEIIHLLDLLDLNQMCTSGSAKVNICMGDNGGPLIVDNVQVGIASFGNDVGCEIGFPGVHTRLTSYLSWLNHSLAETPLETPFRIY